MNERNELSGKNTYLYHPEISSPSCGPCHYGVRRGFFDQGKSWNLPDIKCSVCSQPVYSFDGGNGYDHYALRFYPPADPDPEKKVPSHTADAASGCVFLRISDRFRRVGCTGNYL